MKHFFLISTLIVLSVSIIGCKREGCTDPDSLTFDEKAKSDDGTCKYEGSVTFWYNEQTTNKMVADNITSLTFYVNNRIIGSTASNIYWTSAPGCEGGGNIFVKEDLGTAKSKSQSYKVVDQDGDEVWAGTVIFNGNTCTATQLVY